jgi:ribosomal protein L37AE/L43A
MAATPQPPTPQCPHCGKKGRVVRAGAMWRCRTCEGFFDDEPDEGGDYSDRDPTARLERQERRRR